MTDKGVYVQFRVVLLEIHTCGTHYQSTALEHDAWLCSNKSSRLTQTDGVTRRQAPGGVSGVSYALQAMHVAGWRLGVVWAGSFCSCSLGFPINKAK